MARRHVVSALHVLSSKPEIVSLHWCGNALSPVICASVGCPVTLPYYFQFRRHFMLENITFDELIFPDNIICHQKIPSQLSLDIVIPYCIVEGRVGTLQLHIEISFHLYAGSVLQGRFSCLQTFYCHYPALPDSTENSAWSGVFTRQGGEVWIGAGGIVMVLVKDTCHPLP